MTVKRTIAEPLLIEAIARRNVLIANLQKALGRTGTLTIAGYTSETNQRVHEMLVGSNSDIQSREYELLTLVGLRNILRTDDTVQAIMNTDGQQQVMTVEEALALSKQSDNQGQTLTNIGQNEGLRRVGIIDSAGGQLFIPKITRIALGVERPSEVDSDGEIRYINREASIDKIIRYCTIDLAEPALDNFDQFAVHLWPEVTRFAAAIEYGDLKMGTNFTGNS